MRPRVKNDSWCYTVSKTSSRRKVKRLTNKRHRQGDMRFMRREVEEYKLCPTKRRG